MTLAKDYTGQIYGRLTAVKRVGDRGGKWLFQCECGAQTVTDIARVRIGMTRSCGCLAIEALRSRSITHGHALDRTVTPTLSSYRNAYSRCYHQSAARYAQYGGRGIKMCARWKNSFEAFLEDMGERPDGTTLDRYPNRDGDYEPGNCRWATSAEQGTNKHATIQVECEGKKISLRQFAARQCVSYKALHKRVMGNHEDPYQASEALKLPKPVLHEGERMTVKEFAARTGVNYKALHSRMTRGNLSPHEAVAALREKARP